MLGGGHNCPCDIFLLFLPICSSAFDWHLSFNYGGRSRGESLTKSERYQLYKELRNCIDITEPRDYSSSEEMVFYSDAIFSRTCYVAFLYQYSFLQLLGTKTYICFNHTEEDVSSSIIPGLPRE
jgi:hypothetical protein